MADRLEESMLAGFIAPLGEEPDQINRPCLHKLTRRGPDNPLRHGSYRTQVCVRCFMWRNQAHSAGHRLPGPWREGFIDTSEPED